MAKNEESSHATQYYSTAMVDKNRVEEAGRCWISPLLWTAGSEAIAWLLRLSGRSKPQRYFRPGYDLPGANPFA